jgi:signal transduction histidine kinase/CheY-like chemotaxis protein
MDWTDLNSKEAVKRHRPKQSADKALTAFCQLAAIRLKMRRAMIFFFDSTYAYVLAEATRTLSLHDDAVFDDDEDALWLGTTKIPRGLSVCEHTVNLPFNQGTNAEDVDSHLIHIINNLTEDTRFCDRPYVTDGPKARFYAGVPITTPKGLKIGAFCVLDDKPHDGLSKKQIAFMQEMGAAVMSHLDMTKAKVQQKRGADMVAALGAFTASESQSRRDNKTSDSRNHVNHQASAASAGLSIGHLESPPQRRPTRRRQSSSNKSDVQTQASDRITNIRERSPRRQRSNWLIKNRTTSDMAIHLLSHPEDPLSIDSSTEDQEPSATGLTPNEVMQSASTLIRNAVDADGVIFLDAAVTGFGNLVNSSMLDHATDDTTASGTDGHVTSDGEEIPPNHLNADDQPCPILGASYASRSGAVPEPAARREIAAHLTPKYLRSILRRFGGAKVWNFNEHGDDYQDEQASETNSASDGGAQHSSSKEGYAPRKRARRNGKNLSGYARGKHLASAFPGVRSLMVIGLFDPQRSQWRAGCIIWSCTPMRMFSEESDMHYLTAFCDVIIAKLARLDADVANNVKSDFISSISHELRSPLHGILGTVEVLQDQNVDDATAEMIAQIDTCGRTLLDIVDHLLEFSRINVLAKHVGTNVGTDQKDLASWSTEKMNAGPQASSLDVDVSLEAVTEEVVESAVYSFCCSKDQRTLSERNVTVSMTIEKHPDIPWDCKVSIGAWKRVCVNLINNALKYTSEGSINVNLKILPPVKKLGRPIAQFSVTDSGRGMSKDFLRTKLFRAFSQEDALAEGTGLGMSMVARIVRGWKGKVDVRSSQGKGSIVSVTMPMRLAHLRNSDDLDGLELMPKVDVLSGLSAHVLGTLEESDHGMIATGRYQQLVTFVRMSSSMGLHVSGPGWQVIGHKDFTVIAEFDLPHLLDMLLSPRAQQATDVKNAITLFRKKPIIVLCKDYISARNLRGAELERHVYGRVEYVAQPCGPIRLATVIGQIFKQSVSRGRWTSRPHSPNTFQESSTPRGSSWREGSTWSGASSPGETDSTRRLPFRTRRTSSQQSSNVSASRVRPSPTEKDEVGLGVDVGEQGFIPEIVDDAVTAPVLAVLNTARSPPPQRRVVSAVSSPIDPEKPCLLLVDDNPINLQLLITYSKKNGHAMLTANDGSKAVDAYKAAHADDAATTTTTTTTTPKPEVVLMDISMPGKFCCCCLVSIIFFYTFQYVLTLILCFFFKIVMDGFEAARQIRTFERQKGLKPVVIIALTGLGSSEAQHEAFISGINLFLTKPVRLKELTRLLGTLKDTFG